jgi:hypothetical protein
VAAWAGRGDSAVASGEAWSGQCSAAPVLMLRCVLGRCMGRWMAAYDPTSASKRLEELDGLMPQVRDPGHQDRFQRVQVSGDCGGRKGETSEGGGRAKGDDVGQCEDCSPGDVADERGWGRGRGLRACLWRMVHGGSVS